MCYFYITYIDILFNGALKFAIWLGVIFDSHSKWSA